METGKWFPPHCWKTAPKQLEKEGCLDNVGELRLQGRGQGNTAAREAPVLEHFSPHSRHAQLYWPATNKTHLFCLHTSRPWLSPPRGPCEIQSSAGSSRDQCLLPTPSSPIQDMLLAVGKLHRASCCQCAKSSDKLSSIHCHF